MCVSGKNYSQGLLLELVLTSLLLELGRDAGCLEKTHIPQRKTHKFSVPGENCVCVCVCARARTCRCVYSRYTSFWVDLSLPTMKGKICPFFTKKKVPLLSLSHINVFLSLTESVLLTKHSTPRMQGNTCLQAGARKGPPLIFSIFFPLLFFFFPIFFLLKIIVFLSLC